MTPKPSEVATIEMRKCGTCPGCRVEAAAVKLCGEINAFFLPKIAALRREVSETWDRELKNSGPNWRERAEEMTLAARRQIFALNEELMRHLDAATKGITLIGCDNLRILVSRPEGDPPP